MPDQILAKLDAIQTTIASLHAAVSGLQAQVSTKADCTAFSALSSTVRAQGSTITSQGGMISAQGQAITNLTSRIDSSCDCRKAAATAQTALDTTRTQAHHLTAGVLSSTSGQLDINLKTGVFTVRGPGGDVSWGDLEKGEVSCRIEASPGVEPLKLGAFTLYGAQAAQVREFQEILAAHDASELKVVKPSTEEGKDFLVVDGQMHINEDALKSAAVKFEVTARAESDSALASRIGALATIRTATLDSGQKVMVGLIRDSKLCPELLVNPERFSFDDGLANTVRQILREELKPGGMLHRS